MTKPGIKTTEFWTTILVDVAATVLVLTHRITAAEWTATTGGTASIYALVRGIVKASQPSSTGAPAPIVAAPTAPAPPVAPAPVPAS